MSATPKVKIAALLTQAVAAGTVVSGALVATGLPVATATALGVGGAVSIALSKHLVQS